MAQSQNLQLRFILSDLDGVIRHYPIQRDHQIEKRFDLPPSTLAATAFEKKLLLRAISGVISDEDWRQEIIKSLSARYLPELVTSAVNEWSIFPGQVDYHYLECLESRFPQIPVALLTNGTSRLLRDLDALKLVNRFHRIFNSAEIGVCKPDEKIFMHVLSSLGCSPSEVLFIDDSISNIQSAKALGFLTHHYRGLGEFQKESFTWA